MCEIEVFENERAAAYDQFMAMWNSKSHYFLSLLLKLLEDVSNKRLLVAGCGTGNEIEQFVHELLTEAGVRCFYDFFNLQFMWGTSLKK